MSFWDIWCIMEEHKVWDLGSVNERGIGRCSQVCSVLDSFFHFAWTYFTCKGGWLSLNNIHHLWKTHSYMKSLSSEICGPFTGSCRLLQPVAGCVWWSAGVWREWIWCGTSPAAAPGSCQAGECGPSLQWSRPSPRHRKPSWRPTAELCYP